MFGSIPLSSVAAALGGYLALATQVGRAYEDMWFRARGEPLTIATWQRPAPAITRAVIIAHGIQRSITQAFPVSALELAAQLVRSGFTVLTLELRGHGASTPSRMIYGIRTQRDLLDAVAASREPALIEQTLASQRMFSRAGAETAAWIGKAIVLTRRADERETPDHNALAPIVDDYTYEHAALQHPSVASLSRIMALVVLGRLRARRGDPGAAAALDEALELAAQTGQLQRLGPVYAARAEAAWLAGNHTQLRAETRAIYALALDKRHPWFTGELGFWRWRAGARAALPPWMAQPFRLQLAGDWQQAADVWERLYCPYERAMALMDGDASAQRQALDIFEQLGTQPIADMLRRKLRAAA